MRQAENERIETQERFYQNSFCGKLGSCRAPDGTEHSFPKGVSDAIDPEHRSKSETSTHTSSILVHPFSVWAILVGTWNENSSPESRRSGLLQTGGYWMPEMGDFWITQR